MFFQKFIDPLLVPFRAIRTKIFGVKAVKGRIKGDAQRVKRIGGTVKGGVNKAKGQAGKVSGAAKGAKDKAGGMKGKLADANQKAAARQGQVAGMQGAPAAAGAAAGGGGGGALNPNPGVKKVGFFRKKLICEQCGQQLDKSWDGCPYCAQAAAAQASAAPASSKTMAFMIDGAGSMTGTQMLAWLVPIEGPQRGELFTLAPNSSIGTDPGCTVVLMDQYMSSHHAEIRAEGGTWILEDKGSTNGTYVNDQRIDRQELVDNDFVKFGGSQVKFKSL